MPDKQMEYRTFNVTSMAVNRDDSEKPRIVGHAAVFDVIGDGGYFRERIAKGAFEKSIVNDDVRALFNHSPDYVLGRNTAGTLVMREDEKGLFVQIDPPDTQFARDLMTSISRGDISQMSFGFEIIDEERTKGEGGELDLYTLREVRLWDVSPVTFPFYKQTDVSVHSRSQWAASQERRGSVPAGMRLNLLKREFNLRRI